MCLIQNCLLFPMVGLKSEIFAFIAENFTVEVLLQNLWTTLYNDWLERTATLAKISIHHKPRIHYSAVQLIQTKMTLWNARCDCILFAHNIAFKQFKEN